jgi:FG-GAP-like repeat
VNSRVRAAVNSPPQKFEEGSYRFRDRKGLELSNCLCGKLLRQSQKRVLLRRAFLSGRVGDFTGDGIPDLVTGGLTVDILPGLGDGTFAPPIHNSANGYGQSKVKTADFNGDGKLDVVTADPGAGTVSVLLGRGELPLYFSFGSLILPQMARSGNATTLPR